MRRTRLTFCLIVIGLLCLPVYGQDIAATAAAPAASDGCPSEPGAPLPSKAEPVLSSPILYPAPAPDARIPADSDTVTTPGLTPSSQPMGTRTLAVTPSPAPAELRSPITLDTALQTAFRYSPAIQAALAGVDRGRGQVREARARFRPTFNVQASSILQGPTTSIEFGEQSIELVPDSRTDASLGILLPLDISNRLGYAKDLADYSWQLEYLSMVGVSEDTVLNVKSAFYNLLRACGQRGVAQAAVDVAASRLENTRSRRRAGTVAQFDVTAAETELANLQQQLISAESRVFVAQSHLNAAMGVDISYPTQVAGKSLSVDTAGVDIAKAIQAAYAQRTEMKAAQLAVTAGRTSISLERTALRPSLNVTGTANYTPGATGLAAEELTWQAGIAVSIPIWDGGVTRARVEQAQAQTAAARSVLDQVKLRVAQEVRVAALDLQEAALRTRTTAQAVELAQEALRLANVRYEAGIAVAVEVTNAESQLTQARFNQVDAEYDYAIALAQLERAESAQPELASLQILAGTGAGDTAGPGHISRE